MRRITFIALFAISAITADMSSVFGEIRPSYMTSASERLAERQEKGRIRKLEREQREVEWRMKRRAYDVRRHQAAVRARIAYEKAHPRMLNGRRICPGDR